jgi:hypothetical protein
MGGRRPKKAGRATLPSSGRALKVAATRRKCPAIRSVSRETAYNFLTNPSGLFKARHSILSSLEAGRYPSWRGNDVAHRILGSLHSWSGLHDLCALQAALRRPAQRHSPPRGRAERSRSSGGVWADFLPCQEKCSRPTGTRNLPRLTRPQHRFRKTFSAKLLSHAYRVTAPSRPPANPHALMHARVVLW